MVNRLTDSGMKHTLSFSKNVRELDSHHFGHTSFKELIFTKKAMNINRLLGGYKEISK